MIFTNTVTLCGKVVKDPIFSKTHSDKSVCKIVLVVERSIGATKRSDYIPIALWGKKAEVAKNKFKKGDTMFVVGSVNQERWETEDNDKRSRIVIQAEKFWHLASGYNSSIKPPYDIEDDTNDDEFKDDISDNKFEEAMFNAD